MILAQLNDQKSWVEDLNEEGSRLKEVFDHFTDVFYITDSDGVIQYISSAVYHHLGYKPEEMIGRRMSEFYVRQQDREKVIERLIASPGEIVNIEFPLRRKDGGTTWASTDARIVLDENGAPQTVEGVSRDISDRKKMELALEANQIALAKARDHAIKMEEAAIKASEAKSSFLANMSHEIRTPMNGVLAMASLLLEDELTDRQRKKIETIQLSGNMLMTILNDVLDIAKIEAEKLDFEAIDFDLVELLGEVKDFGTLEIGNKDVTIEVLTDRISASKLVGDPLRVRQILTNLVSNAVKFTQSGSVTIRAEQTNPDSKTVKTRFSVVDTGVGISDDVADAIFDQFSQADTSTTRQYGGTGLGLSICKSLTELMGGSIGVTSEPGEGSTFWFILPFEASEAG